MTEHTTSLPRRAPARLRRRLKRELKFLRARYREVAEKKESGAGEWLRDNFYLLEREGKSAVRELSRAGALRTDADGLPWSFTLCEQAAESGADCAQALEGLLEDSEPLTAGELDLIPLLLRAAFVHLTAEALRVRTEGDERRIRCAVDGLRALSGLDADALVERFSQVERIFSADPAGVYPHMDEATRGRYRRACARLAEREGRGEAQAAEAILARARAESEPRRRHVGYWLFEAEARTGGKRARGRVFLALRLLLPAAAAVLLARWVRAWWTAPLIFLPLSEILRPGLDFLANKGVAPHFMPRMELGGVVPDSAPTLVTVSCLVPPPDKAGSTAERLEQLYLTNGRGAVQICLLADLKEADTPHRPEDKPALEALSAAVRRLNRKYGGGFLLAVRPRVNIQTQNRFAGYERKRGAITQLIRCIRGDDSGFALLEGDRAFLRRVKYLVALDADTELLMDSAAQLVSAALHPLNAPVVDAERGVVTDGYGILAPKLGTDIFSAAKTPFSRIMAGAGGVTAYDTLSGDVYQDLFGRSVFAGKGLIDVDAFFRCMDDALPDERVLSHDILEGGVLRCGYMSDVEMTDGCPSGMTAFLERQHRWVRGDWQNVIFLGRTAPTRRGRRKNPLPALARFMLFDNLRRSASPVFAGLCLVCGCFAPPAAAALLGTAALLSAAAGGLFAAACSLVSGGVQMLSRKYYSRVMPAALCAAAQALFGAVALMQTAVVSAQAAALALWRQLVGRKKLLEWVTAADTDRGGGLGNTLRRCALSLGLGALLLFASSDVIRLAAILTLAAPFVMWFTALPSRSAARELSLRQQETLRSYAAAMWRFYADLCGERDHFLPPDNVQEAPVQAVAHRTSPTNIGLMLLCTLAARDLGLIDSAELLRRLKGAVESTEKMEKWHGSLYNWYDTRTLRPLHPRFVSTVDTGNYACCLLALYEGLADYAGEHPEIPALRRRIRAQLDAVDLTPYYNKRRRLFHIGYDAERDRLSDSYYDLLMSEARMTSYYAVATRQAPKKHWGALGRTLAREGGFAGPVSWTGTTFEYFMPHLLLPVYPNSLSYEALRFCVYCQRRRAKSKGAPYGCSESGFYAFDPQFNYQYKAHGVQRLGLKRRLNEEYVVSPYSSFLTLSTVPQTSLKNLERLARMGMTGRYGFYEAADFTKSRVGAADYAIVRSYMAHHVGMSLLSCVNLLQNHIMQRRFMRAGQMRAARELLEERIPAGTAVFEDVVERDVPEKPGRGAAPVEEYRRITPRQPRIHLLSNGAYTVLLTDGGASVSSCQGLDVTRRSDDLLRRPQGIFAVVSGPDGAFSLTRAPDYRASAEHRVQFARRYAAYYAHKGALEAGMQVSVHERIQGEQRRFLLKNRSSQRVRAELTVYFEPVLAKTQDDAAHPAFSRLFVRAGYDAQLSALLFSRRARDGEDAQLHLAAGFSEPERPVYDCNRERVLDRPDGVASLLRVGDKAFAGASGVPDPCAALRVTVELPPKGQKTLSLLLAVGATAEEAAAALLAYRRDASSKGAAAPLFDGGLESRLCAALLPSLLFPAREGRLRLEAARENHTGTAGLWALGISGDLPIVLAELRDETDLARVEPYFGIQRRLFRIGYRFDLVLTFREGGEYARPVTAAIRQAAAAAGTEELLGQKGGVHAVDLLRCGEGAQILLRACARYLVPAAAPKLPAHAPDFLPMELKRVAPSPVRERDGFAVEGGRFCGDGFIVERTPRLPWCHVLANERFGTLVSDSALGYTWAGNARENKLTPWYNDTRTDNNGELLILRVGGVSYDLIAGARARFTPDFAEYACAAGPVDARVRVTVAPDAAAKRVDVSLACKEEEPVDAELAYYTEPVLGESRAAARHIAARWENGALFLHNPMNAAVPGTLLLTAAGGAQDCLCDRAAFLSGHWDEHTLAPLPDPCAAVIVRRRLPPKREETVRFILAFGKSPEDALAAAEKSVAPQETRGEARADGGTLQITVHTGEPALDLMVNTWLPHQVEAARMNGRTGFYQCGGAYGFRDQLQDACAQAIWAPRAARRHLLRCCAHQFEQGDVLHWWHELSTGHAGVRTACSDDMLWLPYAVCEYVEITGDAGVLDEQAPFLAAPELAEDERERYFTPARSRESASVYEHCLRAFSRLRTGAHGLPLMGGGDWNDGFSRVGEKSRGESVWLAQFAALVCERFAALCVSRRDSDAARNLLDRAAALKEAVDRSAWNGAWYLRAFFDDGTPLGAAGGGECEIDLLPQAFSVLCEMPDKARRRAALNAALERLADRDLQIVRLFWPPFDRRYDPGYIKGYPPGVRENGGQYTHAAVWLALALLREGRADEAYELLRWLNPAQRCAQPRVAARYQTEPYAVAADVYACPEAPGRGGWTLYTGAAGWLYRTLLCELLGIRVRGGELELAPCLPAQLREFEARVTRGGGCVRLRVTTASDAARAGLILDGVPQGGGARFKIPLDGKSHEAELRLAPPQA